MNRITSRNPRMYSGSRNKGWKKLQRFENLEEKLGIDLIKFVKACIKGRIFSRDLTEYVYFIKEENPITIEGFICCSKSGEKQLFPYLEYGKTWTLTKEKMEQIIEDEE